MWLCGDLDDSLAYLQARSRRQARCTQVEVEVELVACQPAMVGGPGDEGSGAGVHHRQLCVRVGGTVRRRGISPDAPGIADQAAFEVESTLLQRVTGVHGGAGDDHLQRPDVDGGSSDGLKPGLQLRAAPVLGRLRTRHLNSMTQRSGWGDHAQ